MYNFKKSLSHILVGICLVGSLPMARAKQTEKNCGGMSRKELVNRIAGSLDQMAKSYEACSSSQGCRNTALLQAAVSAAFAAVTFTVTILVAKQRAKDTTTAGFVLGAGIANLVIVDEKPKNADIVEMGDAITSVKQAVSKPDLSIGELREYCEALSQSIPLDDLVSSLIQSGRPFTVHIGCDPTEAGYEKMGSIACGRDYKGVFKSDNDTWTFEGYARDEKRNVINSFKNCGKPAAKQICIWGRRYTFDQKARVTDPDYGKIATLRFE